MNGPDDHVPQVWSVVLSWNGRVDTLACLDSLTQSSYAGLRILVVDNASTDGSADAVRAAYPEMPLIENSENLRWAGGNNVGIRYAMEQGADFILLLNNDTVVSEEMVDRLVQAALELPAAGLFAPKIYYAAQPDVIWYAGGGVSLWRGQFWHEGLRERDTDQSGSVQTGYVQTGTVQTGTVKSGTALHNSARDTGYITGAAMLIRREVIESIGEVDERFYLYGEDVDYSLRARAAGYHLKLVPAATMLHKVSASLGAASLRKYRRKFRSNLRLYRKYSPVWSWFTTIPLFVLLDLLRNVFRMITGKYRHKKS